MTESIEDLKGLIGSKGGVASGNLFQVILPPIPGTYTTAREINLLCSNVTLPGRQVQTIERQIGTKTEKIANGSVTDDVSMTFRVLNDYGIKKYFETWQKIAYNPETYQIGYKSDYAKQVVINQVKKGQGFPLVNTSATIFGLTIGASINYITSASIVNQVTLYDAWPITINAIELTNEENAMVEYNIQLAYTKWL